ncbi:hypothetical protein [Gemmata sp.]|uniref:hypothetical protein n=1 Tax=Gemmata sp. TaxID=1914242 RepID=UPI003F726557
MPETMTLNSTAVTGNNDQFTELISVTGASIERTTPSVPAAKSGTLTARTDANTGVLTMAGGHGFISTDVIDVFWSGGSRRGMTATVATNAVTVDGGSGDDLPVVSTVVTAMKPVSVEFVVDGDTVRGFGVSSEVADAYVVFLDDADAEVTPATFRITTAGRGKVWATGAAGDNPLAGVVTSAVKFSHGSTSAAVMKACAVFGTHP